MSTSGPDDTLPPSELQGLDPKDLLQAGLETIPPVTLPPQPVDSDATLPLARPQSTQPAPQVELPLPEELTQLLPVGAYHVESFLGQGGMGAVYKASQVRLKRPVAIKIMRRDMGKDYDFEARFEREAQAMAKLNHPNIVSVIDFGEAGPDYLYIVMELIDGADMMDVIRGGQMTQEMALALLPQVCDALQFAHDHGIVHRDIKPSNIMLTRDGRVKMCDFGLAKRYDVESSFRTQTGTGMGTPDYAAPEQFDPKANIDHRADIYALGVMIYQMITGQLPRGVWKPPSQRAEVAPAWDDIVSRAMQSDPSDRYQHASDIKTDVSSIPLVGKDGSAGTPARPSSNGGAAAKNHEAERSLRAPVKSPPATFCVAMRAGRAPLLFGLIVGSAALAIGAFFAFKSSRSSETPAAVETFQSNESAPSPRAASPATGWNPKVSRAAAELALTKSNSVIIEQNGKILHIAHSKPLPPGDFRFIGFNMGTSGPNQLPCDDLAKGTTEAELKAMLAPIELERVNVKSIRVLNDEICRIIASKPGLKMAGFQGVKMTDQFLSHFSQASRLEDLDLAGSIAATDAGFAHLSKLTNLRNLDLSGLNITAKALASLASADRLGHLAMEGPGELGTVAMVAACPNLTKLRLFRSHLSVASLKEIAKLKRLESLTLGDSTISSAHLTALADTPSLSELTLDACVIPDPTALDAALKQMPFLKKVTVNGVVRSLNPAVAASVTQFPPGQWVKLFTKPEDLPEDLRKPGSGVKWEAGWIKAEGGYHLIRLPESLAHNYGIRGHIRRRMTSDSSTLTEIKVRLTMPSPGQPMVAQYTLGMLPGGNLLSKRYSQGVSHNVANRSTAKPVKAGDEYTLEFAAVGNQLVGRLNSDSLIFAKDDSLPHGQGGLILTEDIHDIEVINLDGLSEPEALRLLGVDEKGNDLRGKSGAAK